MARTIKTMFVNHKSARVASACWLAVILAGNVACSDMNDMEEDPALPWDDTGQTDSLETALDQGRSQAATYQSERYSTTSGCKTAKSYAGYTGIGYVDMGGQGSWFQSDAINGGAGGMYTLDFRYASAGTSDQACEVIVNGISVGDVKFSPTATWTTWKNNSIVVHLRPGMNSVRVKARTTNGGPNIDRFDAKFKSEEAIGAKKFAVVLLDYANDGTAPSVAHVRDGMLSSRYSVANFIKDASYGKTTISADLFGWIVPDSSKRLHGEADDWTNCWPSEQDQFNLLLKKHPLVDLRKYEGYIFVVNRPESSTCTNWGVSTTVGLEPKQTYTSFGTIDTRTFYFSTTFYLPYQPYSRITDSTAAHEIIHALGSADHSNALECGGKILPTTASTTCKIQYYGDLFSIMGIRNQASLPDAVLGERFGWLDKTMMKTVQQTGLYKINALEGQLSNTKAIKIPLANPITIPEGFRIDHLYVEYRGMTGFDERDQFFRNVALKNGSEMTITNLHGALIHGADCTTWGYCLSYLLNMHPNSVDASYELHRMSQAYLYQGEAFKVPLNNIKITVGAVQPGKSIDVKVDYL